MRAARRAIYNLFALLFAFLRKSFALFATLSEAGVQSSLEADAQHRTPLPGHRTPKTAETVASYGHSFFSQKVIGFGDSVFSSRSRHAKVVRRWGCFA